MAEVGGISRTQLGVIESGARLLSVDDVLALCRGLHVTLADLVDGADPGDLELLGL